MNALSSQEPHVARPRRRFAGVISSALALATCAGSIH